MKAKQEIKNITTFYEGKFVKPKFYLPTDSVIVRLGLLLSVYSVQRHFEMSVKKSKSLLDLGCGGGWELFVRKAERVVGVDVSKASLKVAKKLYLDCVRADIGHLPLKYCSFDFVASSDVLGHIPIHSKERVLSEIFRVLKEGGETFHCIETDCRGPLIIWAKKHPSLYCKYMIELDGHYGLELPTKTIGRFISKFKICNVKKVYSGLFWPLTGYVKSFDNGYKEKSVFIKTLVKLSNIIIRNFYLHALLDCMLGMVSRVFNVLTPLNWADGIYILCKKRIRLK